MAYIELETAIKVLRGKAIAKYPASFYMGLLAASNELNNISPADVIPVRHGRWISLTECANEGVYCSICKKKVWKSDYALCSHKSRNKLRSDYCPNCGAKMDLEE